MVTIHPMEVGSSSLDSFMIAVLVVTLLLLPLIHSDGFCRYASCVGRKVMRSMEAESSSIVVSP